MLMFAKYLTNCILHSHSVTKMHIPWIFCAGFLIWMGKDCDSKKFYLVKTEDAGSTDQHLETSAEWDGGWSSWSRPSTYQTDEEYEYEEPEPQRRRGKGPNKSNKSLQSNPDAAEIPGEKRKRRRRPGGQNRIIGGIAASNYKHGETAQEFGQGGGQGGHAFPWAVRVLNPLDGCVSPKTGKRGPGMCGGALISRRLVASAFHCVQNAHAMASVNFVYIHICSFCHTATTDMNNEHELFACSSGYYSGSSTSRVIQPITAEYCAQLLL